MFQLSSKSSLSVAVSPSSLSSRRQRVKTMAISKNNDGYRRALVGKLLKMAVEKAKRVCQEKPSDSHSCAIAWDLVEDYETTLRRMKQTLDDPMDVYCETHPDDLECRIYDV
jgi:hypothetical protein